MIWLSPKFWLGLGIVVALAISHWFMYDAGRTSIQVKWERDIAQRAAQALAAEQAARAREQDLVAQRQKVEEQYARETRRAAAAAAGAQSELDRLRRELATGRRSAGQDSTSAGGIDAACRPEREILGECGEALFGMAREADAAVGRLGALQDYVRNVCTN
jgi:hypothetical protein